MGDEITGVGAGKEKECQWHAPLLVLPLSSVYELQTRVSLQYIYQ